MILSELRTALSDLMGRTDYTVSKMDQHLNWGMHRIQRDAKLPNQEKVIEVVLDADGVIEVPADYLAMKHWFASDGTSFENVPLERLLDPKNANRGASGVRWYSRLRDTWMLKNYTAGETLTIVYYAQWIALVAPEDYNQITVQAPDAVIFGAASYGATYFMDTRVKEFEARFADLKEDLMYQKWHQESSTGAAQTIEPLQDPNLYYGGY